MQNKNSQFYLENKQQLQNLIKQESFKITKHAIINFIVRTVNIYYDVYFKTYDHMLPDCLIKDLQEKNFPFDEKTIHLIKKFSNNVNFTGNQYKNHRNYLKQLFLTEGKISNVANSHQDYKSRDKQRNEDTLKVKIGHLMVIIDINTKTALTIENRNHSSISNYINSQKTFTSLALNNYNSLAFPKKRNEKVKEENFILSPLACKMIREKDLIAQLKASMTKEQKNTLLTRIINRSGKVMKNSKAIKSISYNKRYFYIQSYEIPDTALVVNMEDNLITQIVSISQVQDQYMLHQTLKKVLDQLQIKIITPQDGVKIYKVLLHLYKINQIHKKEFKTFYNIQTNKIPPKALNYIKLRIKLYPITKIFKEVKNYFYSKICIFKK